MFESFAAVMMLVLFIVPGYIWWLVESHVAFVDPNLEWEKFALSLLSRSTCNYILYAPFLFQGWERRAYESAPVLTALLAVMLVVIQPAILGFYWGKGRQREVTRQLLEKLGTRPIQQSDAPSAWDAAFNDVEAGWVVVTLKDRRKIRGFLGSKSHISSNGKGDLYISHSFALEQGKWRMIPNTNGVYIASDEISVIEFFQQTQTSCQTTTKN